MFAVARKFYDAIFYPLVKALLARQKEVLDFRRGRRKYVWLFFPIVVLNSDIYSLHAGVQQLEKKNHITFVRELKSKKINGDFALDFVKVDTLADFIIKKVLPFSEHLAKMVAERPELFLDKRK